MKKAELVFIPSPGAGHLVPAVEFSKRLISHDARLSVTILAMDSPFQTPPRATSTTSTTTSTPLIQEEPCGPRFVALPQVEPPPIEILQNSIEEYLSTFVASHSHHVREEIISLQNAPGNPVCLIVDMFCISMVDVAHELGIPSYVFFTSGAAFLGFILHSLDRYNRTGLVKFDESEPEVVIPSYRNPVPSSALPAYAFNESAFTSFINHVSKFKEVKGIVVNTVAELEPYAIESLLPQVLPVYTVGPVLDLKGQSHGPGNQSQRARVMKWLDDQPESSVVFLCFGSVGSFSKSQVKEMAAGIIRSGQRFLWSLRKQTTAGARRPTEYTESELKYVLPDGLWALVDQGRGMVCGWAPQAEILAHKGVGSFVSHCGWNSTLESIWFGKPMVAWPLYAEQRANAFELVSEFGLAATWLGLGSKSDDIVGADEIERAIKLVMAKDNNQVKIRAKEMSEVCRKAAMEGGSSFNSIGCFIRSILGEELWSILGEEL